MKKQGEDKARLGISALMWISHAKRPLKTDELCHTLAVEIGSPNLNTDNVPSIGTLLPCCRGLVMVEKEVSTVRLIHFTLQEYLRAHLDLFGPARSRIAETCITYLNSQQVKSFSTSPSPALYTISRIFFSILGSSCEKGPFRLYETACAKAVGDYNSHISTKILLKAHTVWGVDVDKFSGFSGLHCASLFGIVEIVAGFVGRKVVISTKWTFRAARHSIELLGMGMRE